MRKKRAIQRITKRNGQANIVPPMPVIAEPPSAPPHSAFVITIAYDPQSEVVNYNTTRQGDGAVYVEDQIKALRNTHEAFVARLAIEVHKAAQAQTQPPQPPKG